MCKGYIWSVPTRRLTRACPDRAAKIVDEFGLLASMLRGPVAETPLDTPMRGPALAEFARFYLRAG